VSRSLSCLWDPDSRSMASMHSSAEILSVMSLWSISGSASACVSELGRRAAVGAAAMFGAGCAGCARACCCSDARIAVGV